MNAEKELVKRIKKLRKGMGYTQAQLAELVDIDDKHLSKIEKLCEAFGVIFYTYHYFCMFIDFYFHDIIFSPD